MLPAGAAADRRWTGTVPDWVVGRRQAPCGWRLFRPRHSPGLAHTQVLVCYAAHSHTGTQSDTITQTYHTLDESEREVIFRSASLSRSSSANSLPSPSTAANALQRSASVGPSGLPTEVPPPPSQQDKNDDAPTREAPPASSSSGEVCFSAPLVYLRYFASDSDVYTATGCVAFYGVYRETGHQLDTDLNKESCLCCVRTAIESSPTATSVSSKTLSARVLISPLCEI